MTAERIPDHPWWGTKVGDGYTWKSWKESQQLAKDLSLGMKAFDLASTVEAEGKEWKFCGIQSKNRWEWTCAEMANIHQGITSIALYDTLGAEAMKFIID